MNLSLIVAMTKDRVIGNKGGIPWHIPEDLKLFKEITEGNPVIMGRKTWDSLPEKYKPLPGRTNIILTNKMKNGNGFYVARTLEDALEFIQPVRTFIIGGAKVYAAALPHVNEMHISEVKKDYKGRAKFPEVDFSKWNAVVQKDFPDFVYTHYVKK